MEEKKSNCVIPPFIVREKDVVPFKEAFYNKLAGCNKSYKALHEMKDLEFPEDPKAINADDVNSHIDEVIKELTSSKLLTFENKERSKKEWNGIRETAIDHIQKVRLFIEDYPDAEIEVKDGSITCPNAEDYIFDHCKKEVPKEVYEYFNLVKNIETAIEKWLDFEKAHNLLTAKKGYLENILQIAKNPYWFADNWFFQHERIAYAKKHDYMLAAMEMQTRRTQAEHQARMNELADQYEQEHPDDYYVMYNKYQKERQDCLHGTVKMQ